MTKNVSTFEFPLLISPDPKNFKLEKLKLKEILMKFMKRTNRT